MGSRPDEDALNDGGSAFPGYQHFIAMNREDSRGPVQVITGQPHGGMSLRDYFAAQVLAGWNEGYHSIAWKVGEETPGPHAIAASAYQIADAMLKAREVK